MFICTDPLSAAVIKRFVHEHLRGMYRSTFSPSALIIASSSSRGVVERRTIARRARPRGRTPVHSIRPIEVSFGFYLSTSFRPHHRADHTYITHSNALSICMHRHHESAPTETPPVDVRGRATRGRRHFAVSSRHERVVHELSRVRERRARVGRGARVGSMDRGKNRRRSFARARRGGRREGRGKEDGWMDARVASAREGSAVISFRRMRGED